MRSPAPQGARRPAGDDCVDRRQVQGGQPSQPSRTNRPGGLIHFFVRERPLPRPGGAPHRTIPHFLRHIQPRAPVALARGSHPVPSRTRKLSPSAPMVLRLRPWESRSPPAPPRTPRPPSPAGGAFLIRETRSRLSGNVSGDTACGTRGRRRGAGREASRGPSPLDPRATRAST
jgi:hypothetical protein